MESTNETEREDRLREMDAHYRADPEAIKRTVEGVMADIAKMDAELPESEASWPN